MRKRIKKVQTAKWPTSRKLRPIGSTSQISFNKSSRKGRGDSARNETLRTTYQSIKSNNTELAQCYQSECLKSANLAEELMAVNQQLMDSVMESSILKAQLSKCERLKKITQKRIGDLVNKGTNCYRTMQLRFSEMESLYFDFTQELQSVKYIFGEEIVAPSEIRTLIGDSVLSPKEQQNNQKTSKIQKMRPSIGEFRVRDPVIHLQRIESAPLTSVSVSSSSDREEQGGVTLETVSLPDLARMQERRKTMFLLNNPIRDPVIHLQRIESTHLISVSVSSPSDREEQGDVTLENVSLPDLARKQKRQKTMFVPRRLPKRIVSLSPDQNNWTQPESSPNEVPDELPGSKVILKKLSFAEIEQFISKKWKCQEENGSSPKEVISPIVLLKRNRNLKHVPEEVEKPTSQQLQFPEKNLDDNISSRLNSTYTVDGPLTNGTAESNNVEHVTETINVDAASNLNCKSWGELVARPSHLPVNDPLEGTSSLYITLINDTPEKISRNIKSSDEKGGNSKNVATKRISNRRRRTPKRFLLAQSEKCQVVSVNNETEDLASEAKNNNVHETLISTNDVAEECRTEDSVVERTVFAAPTIIDDTLFGSPSRKPLRGRRPISETIASLQEIEVILPPRRAKSRISYKESHLNSKLRQPPT